MSAEHIALINPGKPVTIDMAVDAMEHIKPGETNFSHFYLPQNLDGMNGVYPDFPKGTDVYVVGDLHGDFDLLVNLLTKVMKVAKRNPDGSFDWIRANSWVVCVGDMVDRHRKNESYVLPDGGTIGEGIDDVGQIQDLLNILTLKGHLGRRNNKIIKLLGNHDILITSPQTPSRSDFFASYVTKKAISSYQAFYDGLSVSDKQLYSPDYSSYCSSELARKILGGNTAVICNIGRWFYTHGGVIRLTVDKIIENCFPKGTVPSHNMLSNLNNNICSMIYGFSENPEVAHADALDDKCYTFIKSQARIDDQNSPLWLRKLGMCGDPSFGRVDHICDDVNAALKSLKEILDPYDNQVYIVVAHCPQTLGKYAANNTKVYSFDRVDPYINDEDRLIYNSPAQNISITSKMYGITYTCPDTDTPSAGGKLWRIDCAMSRAFDSSASFQMFTSVIDNTVSQAYDYYRARRPQCMLIKVRTNGDYVTKVIVGKEGLDRSPYFAHNPTRLGMRRTLPVDYNQQNEPAVSESPNSLRRTLSIPDNATDWDALQTAVNIVRPDNASGAAGASVKQHNNELVSIMNRMSTVPSESLNNNYIMQSVPSESLRDFIGTNPMNTGRKVPSPAFVRLESPSPPPVNRTRKNNGAMQQVMNQTPNNNNKKSVSTASKKARPPRPKKKKVPKQVVNSSNEENQTAASRSSRNRRRRTKVRPNKHGSRTKKNNS